MMGLRSRPIAFAAAALGCLLAGAPDQARAGYWHGGAPDEKCTPMDSMVEAIKCSANESYGDLLDGLEAGTIFREGPLYKQPWGPPGEPPWFFPNAQLKCWPGEMKVGDNCIVKEEPSECDRDSTLSDWASWFGNPIDLRTGAKVHSERDLVASTGPHRLELRRHYNSLDTNLTDQGSRLGLRWRTDFDVSARHIGAFLGTPRSLLFRLPDGSEPVFRLNVATGEMQPGHFNQNGQVASRLQPFAYAATFSPTELTLRIDDEVTYRFGVTADGSSAWSFQLTAIERRDGDVQTLTYDAQDRNTRVENLQGDHIDFTYDADGRLIEATTGAGAVARYTYEDVTRVILGLPPANGYLPYTPPNGFPPTTPYAFDSILSEAEILPSDPSDPSPPEITRYHYENFRYPYHLTGITDAAGVRFASYEYDDSGRATSSGRSDGAGGLTYLHTIAHPVRFTTNVNGDVVPITVTAPLVSTLTNPLGHVETVEVEDAKRGLSDFGYRRLVSRSSLGDAVTPPHRMTRTHSAIDGFPEREVQEINATETVATAYDFDARGLQTEETLADGTPEAQARDIEWHANLRLPTRLLEPNLDTRLTYDASGRLTQVEITDRLAPRDLSGALFAPDIRRWTYAYDAEGLLVSVDGPLVPAPGGADDVTSFAYDAQGRLVSSTDPLGHVTLIQSHNSRGQPLRVVEPDGVITDLSYDFRGRLVEMIRAPGPDQTRWAWTYDAVGQVITETAPDGDARTHSYDAARRLTRVVDGLGQVMDFAHNALGQATLTEIRPTLGAPTTWEERTTFDSLGRPIALIDGANRETRLTYDRLGRVTSIEDGLGAASPTLGDGVTTADLDPLGRPERVTDRVGGAVERDFDAGDALTAHRDPRLLETRFTLTGFGEVVEEISPDRGARQIYRDARGLPIREIDPRGVETLYTHNARGDLVDVSYPAAPAERVEITLGAPLSGAGAGKPAQIDDDSGRAVYAYDAQGRLNGIMRTLEGRAYILDLETTPGGQEAGAVYPSGRVIELERDAIGRLTRVLTRAAAGAPAVTLLDTATHAPLGPLTGFTHGNGVRHEATLDASYLPTRWRDDFTSGAALQDADLSFDANGNVLNVDHTAGLGVDETFTYDAEDRLTFASGDYGTIAYAYDLVGNRISRIVDADGAGPSPAVTEALFYGAADNRLTQVSAPGATRDFLYDAAGNIIQDTRGGQVLAYAYNDANRLAEVRLGGVLRAQYVYDHLGQLAIRRLFDATGALTGVIHSIHDAMGRRIAEHDGATGAVLREYVWIDWRPVAAIEGGTTLLHVHADHMMRPVAMTDAGGAVVWQARWTPFGALHAVTDATRMAAAFPGQWFQAEAALWHNHWRDYDPTLGRYLQADRLGLIDGPALYAYAQGNPQKYVDPTGEWAHLIGPALSLARAGHQLWTRAMSNYRNQTSLTSWAAGTAIGGAAGGASSAWAQYMFCEEIDINVVAGGALTGAYAAAVGFQLTGRPGKDQWGRKKVFSHAIPAKFLRKNAFGRWLEGSPKPWKQRGPLRDLNGNYMSEFTHWQVDRAATYKGLFNKNKGPHMLPMWKRFFVRAPGWLTGTVAASAYSFGHAACRCSR